MKNNRVPVLCLISNDLQLAYLINRYAENCGCLLTRMGHAEPFLEKLSGSPADLIVLDVSQVEREFWMVISQLKSMADLCQIPLVLYSANDIAWQAGELDGYRRLSHSVLFDEFKQVLIENGIQIPTEGGG
jgi:CheY-like chemotaxis protein